MTEGVFIEGKSLEELQREITCGICQEHYTEPKVLPCLHYYCKQCILKLSLRAITGEPFFCPECRCVTALPEGGVNEFKTAFSVNRLKTTVSRLERAHGMVKVKCELCVDTGNRAEAFCDQCAMFICNECINQHKRMKPFLSHELTSLEDLKQGTTKSTIARETPTNKCLVHEEPLNIHCFDCESLICHHCTVKDHKDHDFEFCKKAAPETKAKLIEELQPLKQIKMTLCNAVEKIQTTQEELNTQGDCVAGTIQSSFTELHEILVKREKKLLQKAETAVQEKLGKLSNQKSHLSHAVTEVQSVVDYTEQCIRHGSDNEIMSMHAEIRSRIKQQKEEHRNSGWSMEPVEEVDIGVEVRCAEALQQLCENQADVIRQPIDPAKSNVTTNEVVEVSKTAYAAVITRLSNSKITKRNCTIHSQLKCASNGVVQDCKIDQSGPGEYSIEYMPTLRGYHELSVLIDGQPAAGSPLPVSACIPPMQLGKPVKMWPGISEPSGITVNSVGDILVTELSGSIIKYSADGRREVLVRQSKLNSLRGITVDDKDNIYCVFKTSNEILTCDKNGSNIRLHTVKQVKGLGHRWVRVFGNEVMVSECPSIGTIVVYNREFVYLRCIEQGAMGEVGDISMNNEDGSLYATDYTNSCIRVFSRDGYFLRSFDSDSNGLQRLDKPRGICISGQYVYVINLGSHSLSVFTVQGVYVTSFGQCGNKKGDFRRPCFVCADKNCFLYVTDYDNNRVQCF